MSHFGWGLVLVFVVFGSRVEVGLGVGCGGFWVLLGLRSGVRVMVAVLGGGKRVGLIWGCRVAFGKLIVDAYFFLDRGIVLG